MPPVTTPLDGALSDAILGLVPDPLWIVDQAGQVTTFNAAFERWWAGVSGQAPHRGMKVDPTISLHDAQQRALGGRTVMIDFHVVVSSTARTYAIHARPLADGGTVVGAGLIAREIEERSQATEATIELALTNLFANDDEPPPAVMTKAVEFLCSVEGWDAGVIWTNARDEHRLRPEAAWFSDPELRARLGPRLAALEFEYGHGVPGRVWASREVIWIPDILDESTLQRREMLATSGLHSAVGAPLMDSTRVTGVIEFFTRAVRPISERRKRTLTRTGVALGRLMARRRAEDERRWLLAQIERKSAEWMLTFDAIELPIFLVTEGGTVTRLNRAGRDFSGTGYDDLIGRDLRDLGQGEPWTTLADTARAVCDSGVGCTAQITSGQATWEVSANLLWSPERDEERVVIVLRELTQILNLQDAVRRGEQLAALGELVAGVAHEVKNPIFGMSMTIDLLCERFEGNGDAVELLGALRTWLSRLNSLTENLLEYGKTWNINLAPGRLNEVVRQTLEICQPLAADANVTIDCDGPAGDDVILMDAGRLVHAFENLVTNAIQFSPKGERVTIKATRSEGEIEYSVRDHGPGFVPDDLPRIFQPFFTRRRSGTGLGLSIVQRVLDEHGGIINAENHEGGGAVVRIRFPLYVPPV